LRFTTPYFLNSSTTARSLRHSVSAAASFAYFVLSTLRFTTVSVASALGSIGPADPAPMSRAVLPKLHSPRVG
jgi:hypothetical protein